MLSESRARPFASNTENETQEDGKRGVSARYRIGTRPWYNANGELVAVDLDELHLSPNTIKRTAVDENGNSVNGVGDSPN